MPGGTAARGGHHTPSILLGAALWPTWARVLAVYAANGLITTLALLVTMHHEDPSVDTASLLSYLSVKADGSWYRSIAEHGYPATLPVDASGAVLANAWAFYPAYPLVVRGAMAVGVGWTLAAPTVSIVLGGLAMITAHQLIAAAAPRAVERRPGLPLATVGVLSAYPAAAVLRAGYAESLALLAVALALLELSRRRYLSAGAAALVLGLTRPVALPLVVAVVLHGVSRWRAAQSGRDVWDSGVAVRLSLLTVSTAAAGVAWPLVAGWATGVPDAYVRTQMAWRQGRAITPFGGWAASFDHYPRLVAPLVLAGLLLMVVLLLPASRRLGPELWGWAAAYPAYLVAALELHTSMIRFGILAFPLVPATIGLVTRPRRRTAWVWSLWVLCVVVQIAWTWWIWRTVLGDAFDPSP